MNSIRALVVDDNIINQKVAVKMLERLNIIVDVAFTGLEAVDAFKKTPYHLILMDVQMPVMDGLDATRAIRAIEQDVQNDSHPTIIALTANAMHGDRERCLQAGMDDYLSKPIKQQDITMIVDKWLSTETNAIQNVSENSDAAIHEIIDPKRIEQIKEIGDASLLQELLKLYLEDLKQFSSDIQSAQTTNNFQQIFESSHKLKGSSANLGVESIRQACISMEQYAKDHLPEKISAQMAAMQEMIEQVRMHITATFPAR